jgi:hypothetical protein
MTISLALSPMLLAFRNNHQCGSVFCDLYKNSLSKIYISTYLQYRFILLHGFVSCSFALHALRFKIAKPSEGEVLASTITSY